MADRVDMLSEFERMRDKRIRSYIAAMNNLVRAVSARETTRSISSHEGVVEAMRSLGNVIVDSKLWGDALGRRRVLLEVEERKRGYGLQRGAPYAAREMAAGTLANVEFVEATEDIVERHPEIRPGFEAVQELYQSGHGFALARSSERSVTERVQALIADALRTGKPLPSVENILAELGGWTQNYAATVFQTNISSAYANGRMSQAFSPELDDFIVAFRRVATLDDDCRPNHRAAHGLVARKRDPIWLELGVPAGYRCRCGIQMIDSITAQRQGLVIPMHATAPAGAYNDEGFERSSFEAYGLVA
jgi:SPP1 gp7 family putative phage head morphogenesis protein